MAYIIAEPCIGTKDSACVDACPVDCIHPKKDEADHAEAEQLFIDPVECIDCGACVPVCPVSAIFAGDDLPAGTERKTGASGSADFAQTGGVADGPTRNGIGAAGRNRRPRPALGGSMSDTPDLNRRADPKLLDHPNVWAPDCAPGQFAQPNVATSGCGFQCLLETVESG